MHELDLHLNRLAAANGRLLRRQEVLRHGGTSQFIEDRLARGQWTALHPGTYLVGVGPLSWHDRLRAAWRAAGEGAVVSHRAATLVWGLDGLAAAPIELTVPFGRRSLPAGAIVHRSRRDEAPSVVDGFQITSVERTLLELGAVTSPVVVEKAFSAAWRRNLTSPTKCERYLEVHGGKGRRGATLLREVIALYGGSARAAGSAGEVAFLRLLRAAGIEEPARQYLIDLGGGRKVSVDFAWPARRKLIEFVGLAAHASSRAHADDTLREDDIKSAGWELRRFAPESLRTRPDDVARRAIRFLCT